MISLLLKRVIKIIHVTQSISAEVCSVQFVAFLWSILQTGLLVSDYTHSLELTLVLLWLLGTAVALS